jgi:hypothetical protein
MTTIPTLQTIQKGILYTEDENKHNHERRGSIKPHDKDINLLHKRSLDQEQIQQCCRTWVT